MPIRPDVIKKFEEQFLVETVSNGSLSNLNDGLREFVVHLPNTHEEEVSLFAEVHGLEFRDEYKSKKFIAFKKEGDNPLTLTIIWDKLFFDKFTLAIRLCNEPDGPTEARGAFNVFRSVFRLGSA